MRKKIVKVVPFSPNVEKVFYSDSTWGLRGTGAGSAHVEKIIPDQGRTGRPLDWQDSMDGEPASSNEVEEIMEQLRRNPSPDSDEQPLPTKGQ